ncbi:DNA-protecting protein DprA [Corynebacterium sp. sy017]|uniref:DNA-processing protein DprA n=1 Tax=unclassified Corynebacterium TaxID=2624378 RepID=UPI001186605D|nr:MULTISPECIES: DNA-processing protein DprA [unclassified Corynebacterium]MBP3087861.1 DNA-protecting protein DprA [Corynebacterium sp. sy017]TSD92402.1 DNA-protecting protein DprA [Corynebacterium sp. SY003]
MKISERTLCWAYLSRVLEGPSKRLQELLSAGHDVEEIVSGIKNRSSWIGGLLGETQARYNCDRSQEDLAQVESLGGWLLTPDSEQWPYEQLNQAFGFAASGRSEHARSYQEDAVMPHALWVRGSSHLDLGKVLAQSVAIVGTRAVSSYGIDATQYIAEGLAQHKWTIVSGGALGVDAVAHKQALDSGGVTIAVSACGIDRFYPAGNRNLFDKIVECGLIVSEYPPGHTPQRHRFLTRNRLVAAFTQGTVVMEAAWRSGALNTLNWAQAFGKVTMAVPGPITGVGSLGCHEKIRNGQAQLVCSADEVRALLSAVGEVDPEQQYEIDFAPSHVQALSRNELRVFDVLGAQAKTSDQIVQETALSLGLCMYLLVVLERKGLVVRAHNAWRRAV